MPIQKGIKKGRKAAKTALRKGGAQVEQALAAHRLAVRIVKARQSQPSSGIGRQESQRGALQQELRRPVIGCVKVPPQLLKLLVLRLWLNSVFVSCISLQFASCPARGSLHPRDSIRRVSLDCMDIESPWGAVAAV